MHPLIRWHIKTSLVNLSLLLLVGILLAAQGLWKLPLPGLFPVYFHLLTMGWLTLLIFGVATWMFPTHSWIDPRSSEVELMNGRAAGHSQDSAAGRFHFRPLEECSAEEVIW